MKDCQIIVVAHQDTFLPPLPEPYKEVCIYYDEVKPQGYQHYASEEQFSLKFPKAWSEVAILLNLDSFASGSSIVGLAHYRRFFILNGFGNESIRYVFPGKRSAFLKSQVKYLELMKDYIVVPRKVDFTISAWDQFIEAHDDLEELMNYSCAELDIFLEPLFGKISSKQVLKDSNSLYPFNMFIGKIEFYQEWREILGGLVTEIEDRVIDIEANLPPRWGGFIVERLFSVYITLCISSGRWELTEKTVATFNAPPFWRRSFLRIEQILTSERKIRSLARLVRRILQKLMMRATAS